MPRVPDSVLNVVFFVYPPDEKAARAGRPVGGCGFIVTVESTVTGYRYVYGVTNWHVAIAAGNSYVRVNRKDGQPPDIFPFDSSEWTAHPDGFDIAVIPLPLNPDVHDVSALPLEEFATHANSFNKGLGDDVFMAGRFVDHDGGATNVPSLRFGNIAVMPTAMEQRKGKFCESYVIDLHSRTGYSGSPVFIFRTPGTDLDYAKKNGGIFDSGPGFLHLLGIHWSQFADRLAVYKDPDVDKGIKKPPIGWAENYSAMTCVVPAERIVELLNMPKFKKQRAEGDVEIARIEESKRGARPGPEVAGKAVLESAAHAILAAHAEPNTATRRSRAKRKN